MDTTTVTQNRSNSWTGFGFLLAVVLIIASGAGMINYWPIEASFEWLLLPILFVGAAILGGNYLYWLVSPRNAVFSVSADEILIEDQPVFRWVTRTFTPSDVVEIACSGEGSCLRTRDGKAHILSDILMMERAAIFSAIAVRHPHVVLTVNGKTEQTGTGQPATRPVAEPECSEKPQPDAEGRSR